MKATRKHSWHGVHTDGHEMVVASSVTSAEVPRKGMLAGGTKVPFTALSTTHPPFYYIPYPHLALAYRLSLKVIHYTKVLQVYFLRFRHNYC